MSKIYVFGPNEDENDYSTWGLAGSLVPSKCSFREVANSDSVITLSHPLDEFGKYSFLAKGNILLVPVPVRTTPEIQDETCAMTVWTYVVNEASLLTTKDKKVPLYKNKTGSAAITRMSPKTVVTVVQKLEDENVRWKVKSPYGTGWIDPSNFTLKTEYHLENNSSAIEDVQSAWTITPQYFRIVEDPKSLTDIQITARHIRYDLLYTTTRYTSETAVSLQTAIDGVLDNCDSTHKFKAYTNVANTQAGLFYELKSPIDAYFEPEEGICKKFNVSMVSDNYDLYFLHDPGINRGVKIKYRKNMLGISFKSSDDAVATRIIPYGETKDGKKLYLHDTDRAQQYVDSEHINDYPYPHIYPLQCENCKVGSKDDSGGTITIAVARARMLQQANNLLATGCDQPKIEMSVKFINLGDTEEYSQFKNLENCFLFDYVTVQHPDHNIDVTAQIVSMTWDCLLDRMESVEIGTVGKTLANTGITSAQVPNGFNGSKIGSGTVGSAALGSDVISVRHMQAGSVNADAIQTGSITADKFDGTTVNAQILTAVKAKIDEVVAGEIFTDEFYASVANIVTLRVEQALNAGTIETDALRSALANIGWAEIRTAIIDYAQIKDVDLGTGIFDELDGGKLVIDRLSVTQAQIVDAVIGSLTLVDNDGKMYKIGIGTDGQLTTTYTGTQNEAFANGALPEGYRAVASDLTVGGLNATRIVCTGEATFIDLFASNIVATMLTVTGTLVASLIQSELAAGLQLESKNIILAKVGDVALNRVLNFTVDGGLALGDSATTNYLQLLSDAINMYLQGDKVFYVNGPDVGAGGMAIERSFKIGAGKTVNGIAMQQMGFEQEADGSISFG